MIYAEFDDFPESANPTPQKRYSPGGPKIDVFVLFGLRNRTSHDLGGFNTCA